MEIKQNNLTNGLKIYMDHVPHVESILFAVMVKCGSGHENSQNNGVAHFLEHMMFKGTKTRTAKEISEAVENVGGEINAFTSKEKTMYYIKVLKEDVAMAVEILSDVIQNSLFDAAEIEKERGVILQELASCLDTPSDIVFDYFAEGVFGADSSLGRSILGKAQTIKSISRDDLVNFLKSNYTANNMIVGVVGNFDQNSIVELIQKNFGTLEVGAAGSYEVCKYKGCGVDVRSKKDLEQLQFVMGFKGYSADSFEMKYKAGIVASAIGGGMSSIFFQEIREKRGLVYSIGCFADSYKHEGVVGLYAALDIGKLEEFMETVSFCFKESVKSIGDVAIARTIKQYQATILMRQESLSARMGKMLTDFLMYGRYISSEEVMSHVQGFKSEDASNFLKQIISGSEEPFSIVLYGDFEKNKLPKSIENMSKYDLIKN